MPSGIYKRTKIAKENIGKAHMKHGMHGTRTYNIWRSMTQRCLNKTCKSYKDYGGRGIKVCDNWLKFINFYNDMGEKPKNKSLNRLNNNLGYCKNNCKWSTEIEQHNNTRKNVFITYNGKTQTIAQWAKELNINYQSFYRKLNKYNWNLEKVF